MLLPSATVAVTGSTVCWLLSLSISNNLTGLLTLLALNSLALSVIVYFIGTSEQERRMVRAMFCKIKTRVLLNQETDESKSKHKD